jgi:hypothetical protein
MIDRKMFQLFSEQIKNGAVSCVVAEDSTFRLIYVPFEHVTKSAKLAIVGITPGSTQIAAAYAAVRPLLLAGLSHREILEHAIKQGAFQGIMRTNLIKIMAHFGIGEKLGIAELADLWGRHAGLLHSTSVIPHAAFRRGKMFNGNFDEILAAPLLRSCFERCFVPTLAELDEECRFIALGPTPLRGLKWCAERGHISADRILGAFPHPSGSSGSAVPYFLRAKQLGQLAARDPVRQRAAMLDQFYTDMRQRVDAWASSHNSQACPS